MDILKGCPSGVTKEESQGLHRHMEPQTGAGVDRGWRSPVLVPAKVKPANSAPVPAELSCLPASLRFSGQQESWIISFKILIQAHPGYWATVTMTFQYSRILALERKTFLLFPSCTDHRRQSAIAGINIRSSVRAGSLSRKKSRFRDFLYVRVLIVQLPGFIGFVCSTTTWNSWSTSRSLNLILPWISGQLHCCEPSWLI